jgi:hypothetical protein
MFWAWKGKGLRDDFCSVIQEIENGTPTTPKHSQPPSVDHQGFASCIDEHDRVLFAKTTYLGDMLNRHLSWGAWRVQELARNAIPSFDGPKFGRRYELFYNSHLAGEVSLYADFQFRQDDPLRVSVEVDVEAAQLFPFYDLHGLLKAFASLVVSEGKDDFDEKSRDIDRCLTGTLWEAVRCPDRPYSLAYRATGGAHHFIMKGVAQKPTDTEP